mmetsp:Transcript_19272/g.43671  ORF Transcript_19272/g.43671 Transcript_19272/m.43671 type:complete len:323 (+) Transcript_19272:525-1493(+)
MVFTFEKDPELRALSRVLSSPTLAIRLRRLQRSRIPYPAGRPTTITRPKTAMRRTIIGVPPSVAFSSASDCKANGAGLWTGGLVGCAVLTLVTTTERLPTWPSVAAELTVALVLMPSAAEEVARAPSNGVWPPPEGAEWAAVSCCWSWADTALTSVAPAARTFISYWTVSWLEDWRRPRRRLDAASSRPVTFTSPGEATRSRAAAVAVAKRSCCGFPNSATEANPCRTVAVDALTWSPVHSTVGCGEGEGVGCGEGCVGWSVGRGLEVGCGEGAGVGAGVGSGEGSGEGGSVGSGEGLRVGSGEGSGEGECVGLGLGTGVGS